MVSSARNHPDKVLTSTAGALQIDLSDYPAEVDALVCALGQLQQCQEKLLIQAKGCDPLWASNLIEDAAVRVEQLQDDIVTELWKHYPNVPVTRSAA